MWQHQPLKLQMTRLANKRFLRGHWRGLADAIEVTLRGARSVANALRWNSNASAPLHIVARN
jgi:hypothetical protein